MLVKEYLSGVCVLVSQDEEIGVLLRRYGGDQSLEKCRILDSQEFDRESIIRVATNLAVDLAQDN